MQALRIFYSDLYSVNIYLHLKLSIYMNISSSKLISYNVCRKQMQQGHEKCPDKFT